jgi:hypothetical protein
VRRVAHTFVGISPTLDVETPMRPGLIEMVSNEKVLKPFPVKVLKKNQGKR